MPKRKLKPKRPSRQLPSRADILDYIAKSPTPLARRDLVRAFKVEPKDRLRLKALIREVERDGPVERAGKRRIKPADRLPRVGVIEVTGLDLDGEVMAKPVAWKEETAPPAIRVVQEAVAAALGIGERALAELKPQDDGSYEARVIRTLAATPDRVLGIYRRIHDGGRLEPTNRRIKTEFRISLAHAKGAEDGEIVLCEVLPGHRLGLPEARVVERIGDSAHPRAVSLIAITDHGIPVEFPEAAVAEAEAAQPVGLAGRTDLRQVPLVTIDGADARDFDDAVFAEPDPKRPGFWHAVVAIADVGWYVRPGSALDRAAQHRGNSVYFPDRVVPMLPEALSNELCSLKPGVERACMAVHMTIDGEGRLVEHRFVRGLMRSAARLTYEQVQRARDGNPDETTRPLLEPVIAPLYGVFQLLDRARRKRGALDLDLPERKVVLGEDGRVLRIEPRARLDSHKLIEELMILANVAAAETLERLRQPCMYRVHDAPDPAKLEALREFLRGIGIPGLTLAKGQVVRPQHFNEVLRRAADTPYAPLIHQLVLRSQAQAVYSPQNLGHFGLALRRYAHFTSPIRRYSDVLVHRALIAGLRLGEGGLPSVEPELFAETAAHISDTERRAAAAERDALSRYATLYLSDRVGAEFEGRVNGVTRAGLFVTLSETGADGLLPMRSLGDDFYVHDEARHRLVGRRWGRSFTMGDPVRVRLAEANAVTGSLLLALVEDADSAVRKGGAARAAGRQSGRRPAPRSAGYSKRR
ncbi:MAG TPA: ribonuclease R [Stellaceae bacterium]|nr:ribonuclease R [Stellaceae bacterium]